MKPTKSKVISFFSNQQQITLDNVPGNSQRCLCWQGQIYSLLKRVFCWQRWWIAEQRVHYEDQRRHFFLPRRYGALFARIVYSFSGEIKPALTEALFYVHSSTQNLASLFFKLGFPSFVGG
jgi:hypothetical protein